MPVGDVNSKEKGSGARYNDDKTNWALLPLHLLDGTVRVWMYGAAKYAAWNWAKGMAWSIPYACCMRHLIAWYRGEETDPESGQSHIDHAICNLLMIKHFEEVYREGDDRPVKEMRGLCPEEGETEEDETGHAGIVAAAAEERRRNKYWEAYWKMNEAIKGGVE